MSGIGYNERVFVVGPTGSGKSTLLNHQFSGFACQRLLVDTKDEWELVGPEDEIIVPVRDPAKIDWRQPLIHYRDNGGGVDEFEELFARIHRRRHIVVCVHELADLCDDQPGKAPPSFRAFVRKGRAHGQGLLGGTQRPVGMPRVARSEAQHIFYVLPRLDPEDEKIVVAMCEGAGQGTMHRALAKAESLSNEHAFVWYAKKGRRLRVSPPLPEHARNASIVRSVTVA